jgi:hypothetical protein
VTVLVAVVNRKVLATSAGLIGTAERADSTLRGQHLVVLFDGDAVSTPKPSRATPRSGSLRVGRSALATFLQKWITVCPVVSAISFEKFLAVSQPIETILLRNALAIRVAIFPLTVFALILETVPGRPVAGKLIEGLGRLAARTGFHREKRRNLQVG